MDEKERDEVIKKVEEIVVRCVIDIANTLKGLSDGDKIFIYEQLDELALKGYMEAKERETMH